MCFFFFSSRRRHTRFKCDWSSDVCSSDLNKQENCYCCCEEKCTLSLLPHFQFPLHGSFETSHAAALSENRASAGYLEERLPRRQPARCHKEPASLGLEREPRPELKLPLGESRSEAQRLARSKS